MARIMMICPRPGPATPVYSGIDVSEGADLSDMIATLVDCPHCGKRHTIEAAHFEGKAVPRNFWHGLDCDRDCAAEVGIIMAEIAVIEANLSYLMLCVTGIEGGVASRILGRFEKLVDRLELIEDLADRRLQWEETSEESRVLLKRIVTLISTLKGACTIRNKYGHSFYGAGGDQFGGPGFNISPFHVDTRRKKKPASVSLKFKDVVRDRQKVRDAQLDLHDFLHVEGHVFHPPV